jgi:hypothetical protein
VIGNTALIRQVHAPCSLREVVRETGVCDDDDDDYDDDYCDDVVRVIPRKCDLARSPEHSQKFGLRPRPVSVINWPQMDARQTWWCIIN